MARRSAAIEITMTEQALRLSFRGRALTIANAARPGDDEAEFLVRLDELERWDAPDDATPIEIDELQKICEAIEDFAESRGVVLAFE
ncbi:MAG TPA: Imm74 family immunity protein [Methylocystis sp.]|nr:Imm74 family immunity protein [Methylocystis sp.]